MDSNSALIKLKEGNARFVNGQAQTPRQCAEWRKSVITTQNPFCAVLACSDSRVPVEILFDQGIGDIFVVRLAGNIASDTAVESLAFAAHILKVSLIVVMGHQNCGAVQAVINHLADIDLEQIGSRIRPSVEGKKTIKEAVIANVKQQVEKVQENLRDQKNVKICGAYYDFESGLVDFL